MTHVRAHSGSHAGSRFNALARRVSHVAGHPATFAGALCAILLWAASGPLFHFSDTWQLAINTTTTIITFLMVFLIQNTQNHDTIALELKMDEILRATEGAHNGLLDLEELTEADLVRVRDAYRRLASVARVDLNDVFGRIGVPDVSDDLRDVADDLDQAADPAESAAEAASTQDEAART